MEGFCEQETSGQLWSIAWAACALVGLSQMVMGHWVLGRLDWGAMGLWGRQVTCRTWATWWIWAT